MDKVLVHCKDCAYWDTEDNDEDCLRSCNNTKWLKGYHILDSEIKEDSVLVENDEQLEAVLRSL